jgi:GNAT superfamily N-acetyltransferase
MTPDAEDAETEAALEAERQLVLTLGGFVLEIAGAVLVIHEKIPVPRFNFVEVFDVGRERQAAFFERALDHYFQRALRPTFRVPLPAPEHIDRGLRSFGFRPRSSALVLHLGHGAPSAPAESKVEVREPTRAEFGSVAAFWTGEKERPELLSALDIAVHHPNSRERLVPLLATVEGEPVSAAIVYRYRSAAGIQLVTTRPSARGRGAASALVGHVLRHHPVGAGVRYSILSDASTAGTRLTELGFEPARSFVEYELPADAELAFPSPGPAGPPRWRPPRGS